MKFSKTQWRKVYKQKRKALPPEFRKAQSQKIFETLKETDWLAQAQNIHLFLSVEQLGEVSTQALIQFLWRAGKKVLIPKVEGHRLITCHYTPSTPMQQSRWGIWEPKTPSIVAEHEIDLVITPLLICDTEGTRIGYGGGFYDAMFAQCRPDILKIGVNYFSPINEIITTYESDVPLDYLVTGEATFSFKP
ncbi:5-formyltetrahydrofolate cyclo-ligase [Ornithobacterium rhinotracheale]|uniref:5-formyltetrahydrofolate cyclo-ligase n=1 Tax=Ornithobacterium rhinotracheale TaxID=28251 RepID=UPI00129C851E|nr:5-formyltetrahydrofolate cyclo-ligase [Ornithobacterium rhinotracheale]MRJ10438.1 5-formyltetrahydrofolate cyclo-ligase [Ornithobacterium rhinotracheale]